MEPKCLPPLQALRAELDDIDGQWLALLARRFAVTAEVGQLKKTQNLPARDPEREAQQRARFAALASESGIDPVFAQRLLQLLLDEVVARHQRV
ncbi:chorismate mutase [Chitinolyticbacter albus]|uniref:chorismate mutase n=1 Tax=Chitinolyticbacter albus TaxID=2961951 RepID=UPI002108DE5D|nr:chorismate mutase [Chitinolyticbacter albus]